MPEWDAEIEVDEALAHALIANAYPVLGAEAPQLLGVGWDNTAWLAGERVVFRFPRRAIALPGIRREMALLPLIAPKLPCAIPDAGYPGTPSDEFPWPWFGSQLIEGREIQTQDIGDDARRELARDLGSFLRALHSLEVPKDAGLPVDPNGRADMSARVPRTRAGLERLDPSGDLLARAADVLDRAETLPATATLVLAHGDLHFRHTLVDAGGTLTGIIDWGDICLSAPGIDLALYWSLFSPRDRDAFRATYGEISEPDLLRARVMGLALAALLALYGREAKLPDVEREARAGIERTLLD